MALTRNGKNTSAQGDNTKKAPIKAAIVAGGALTKGQAWKMVALQGKKITELLKAWRVDEKA
jgi:hypothetical protein